VLLTCVVAGLLCAWLWHAWWAPPPEGVVVDGKAYFDPDAEFRGTGTYMPVAFVAGLVIGLVFAYVFEHDEVATLASVVTGAVVAGLVMAWVGHLLGPENATEVARHTADFEKIDGDLHAGPLAAYVAFPGGAVLGEAAVLITFTRRRFRAEPSG
jgi:membrane protease YdiL (CAAX protease family)